MNSINKAGQGGPITESDHFAFPGPENATFLVRIDAKEMGKIVRAVRGGEVSSVIPQAFCLWIRHSDHPAEVWFRVWHFWVQGFVIAWCLLGFLHVMTGWRPIPYPWVIPGVFGLLMLSPWLTTRRVKMRSAKLVLENKGRVCNHCGFLLHGLPEEHTCPECGNGYEIQSLRDSWLRWMNGK
jgi:hypothetical protein